MAISSMTTITERRLHLQLSGLVQGVGFRPWSYRLARQLQLRGWVGNNPGGVCLVLEGPEADLQRLRSVLSVVSLDAHRASLVLGRLGLATQRGLAAARLCRGLLARPLSPRGLLLGARPCRCVVALAGRLRPSVARA